MKYAIKTDNINFSYSKENRALKNLTIEVPKNSIYGFLGPNGSGKTTTIRVILGLLKVKKGEVFIYGNKISDKRLEVLSEIGALIENPSLYEHLSAFNNLKITSNYWGNISKERILEVLETVKLSHVASKTVKTFSLGMKQRLGLAIALLSSPKLLILDEPTNGLDPKGILEMRNLIIGLNQSENITILISSHLLSEIEKMCTHVGIIDQGELVFQGSIKKLKTIKSKQLNVIIEVDNIDEALKITEKNSLTSQVMNPTMIHAKVKAKNTIPILISELINNHINVYQFKIEDNLENLFLNLTK